MAFSQYQLQSVRLLLGFSSTRAQIFCHEADRVDKTNGGGESGDLGEANLSSLLKVRCSVDLDASRIACFCR